MTRIIRTDLEGVVHTYREDGSVGAVLSAGDVVPDGVVVGDHLTAPGHKDSDSDQHDDGTQAPAPGVQETSDGEDGAIGDAIGDEDDDSEVEGAAEDEDAELGDDGEAEAALEAPRGNAATEAWADYADALGVEYEPGATRTDIQAAIAASKTQG